MTGSRYGLKIVQTHTATIEHEARLFCDSLIGDLQALDIIIPPVAYPKGAVLFTEGQPARGIFAVCSGRVKVSTSTLKGKLIILKIAEAGELLGLAATLSDKPYEVAAEISEEARVSFIPHATFLRFLRTNPDAVVQLARLLTDGHFADHAVIQSLGLSRSASEKLARFFLDWSANHAHGHDRLRIALTHEEIGEMIGVSRETVTRLLSTFKNRNLLTVEGSTFSICNRTALESLAGA